MASFDERAREWDTEERIERAAAVARAIRANVPMSPSMRAIEIGAGTGLLGLDLAGEVFRLLRESLHLRSHSLHHVIVLLPGGLASMTAIFPLHRAGAR